MNMKNRGRLFIVSGPSGVGKTTICKELCNHFPTLKWSVSVTTRNKRKGEREGVDYWYMPEKEFLQKVERDEFIEYAQVHGHYYGTLRGPLEEALLGGCHYLLEIDVQGAAKIKARNLYDPVLIFIMPPDLESLHQRLCKRNSETAEVIEGRLKNAAGELQEARFYDHYVVNHDLENTIVEVRKIVEDSIPHRSSET